MASEINWTEEAHKWLQIIYEYISNIDPGKVYRTIKEIYNYSYQLSEYPFLGQKFLEI